MIKLFIFLHFIKIIYGQRCLTCGTPGYYINAQACIQTSPGYYPNSNCNQIPCPPGTYCPNAGMENPDTCQSGYYCPQGSISQIQCQSGNYCPQGSGGQTSCQPGY